MHATQAQGTNFSHYLNQHEAKELLRFITCGSVDDGKSTLIGRLLYENNVIYDDQLSSLNIDSKKLGKAGAHLDFALLVDGLVAEREQGITIDVAYRFFSTKKRKFIVADTPGHEQYTRNMITGASTAELAIVIVDARKGILTQTRRHSFIVSMLGVKQIVLAINKMDLVDYSEELFQKIKEDYLNFAQDLGILELKVIPISALKGDNILTPSTNMPWYKDTTLMAFLDEAPVDSSVKNTSFRMPVQWVNRAHLDFRGFSGLISSGKIKPGDTIKILPSGKVTSIESLISFDGPLDIAVAGQSITCTLNDEIDISRGDVLVDTQSSCEIADQFNTTLLWMSEKPLIAGRHYFLKIGTKTVLCTPRRPKYQIDINSMKHLPVNELGLNEIGCCEIALDTPVAFEPYLTNRNAGGFILIDRMTHETVAAGLIHFALRRANNIHTQDFVVNQNLRSLIKLQQPVVLWLTGLPSSGKSTIANLVELKLHSLAKHTMILDGDNIRHGLNRDLGFTENDRAENIRRIAEVAKLMVEAGLITIVSFISPFIADRVAARERIGDHQFIEIFVDTPLEIAEKRDSKGLFKKARAGEITNFTGIGSPYETPLNAEIRLETVVCSPEECAETIMQYLQDRKIITT